MGGFVGDVLGGVGDLAGGVVGSVGDIGQSAIDAVGSIGTTVDDLVNENLPGGWILPIAVGVAYGTGGLGSGLLGAGEAAAASDAAFIAADAAQLAAQGLGEAQIASTLGASGVSAGAANLAASMATAGLDTATMSQQLGNLSSNTGLFTQEISDTAFNAADAAQLAQQTGNNPLAIEQNLVAAGVDPLEAASLAQQASLAAGTSPTQGMWDQFSNYLKENPSILNTLGKAAAIGASSQVPQTQAAPIPVYRPADTMPTYSPEYYQQVQQYYNTYLPSTPRDVATPLQDWYSSGYEKPDSVTAKLFSGG